MGPYNPGIYHPTLYVVDLNTKEVKQLRGLPKELVPMHPKLVGGGIYFQAYSNSDGRKRTPEGAMHFNYAVYHIKEPVFEEGVAVSSDYFKNIAPQFARSYAPKLSRDHSKMFFLATHEHFLAFCIPVELHILDLESGEMTKVLDSVRELGESDEFAGVNCDHNDSALYTFIGNSNRYILIPAVTRGAVLMYLVDTVDKKVKFFDFLGKGTVLKGTYTYRGSIGTNFLFNYTDFKTPKQYHLVQFKDLNAQNLEALTAPSNLKVTHLASCGYEEEDPDQAEFLAKLKNFTNARFLEANRHSFAVQLPSKDPPNGKKYPLVIRTHGGP